MRESPQRLGIRMDSNRPFGLPAHGVGKQTVEPMRNILKTTAGLAAIKDIFCLNIEGCISPLYSWAETQGQHVCLVCTWK